MTIVGITGPSGAGKTTALSEIKKLGGAVIDCDAVYHQILEENCNLQDSLEQAFGPLRNQRGIIDRKRLGHIVFHNPEQLERLNTVVGRFITEAVGNRIDKCRRQGYRLAAIDASGLLESPLKELCHTTVAVVAPPEIRLQRIMAREGISEDYARARISSQKPDSYYTSQCDHTLVNDCDTMQAFEQKAGVFFTWLLRTDGWNK